jgi:hypothetical protein
VLDGTINPGKVFDYTTDLDDIAEAYAAMDERRATKALIKVTEISRHRPGHDLGSERRDIEGESPDSVEDQNSYRRHMNDNDTRIIELESRLAELTALVERLAPTLGQTLDVQPSGATPAVAAVAPTSSRRGVLKLAGAAAVGVTAAAVAGHATPAAAANNGTFTLGVGNDATNDTVLVGKLRVINDSSIGTQLPDGYSGSLVGWDTTNSATGIHGGVTGFAGPLFGGGETPNGVVGVVSNAGTGSGMYARSDSSVVGTSAGLRARSANGPAVLLEAVAAGRPTAGAWAIGSIVPDTAGNVWYCVASGTPGTWRKISGATTAGAFHAVSPGRVYDSRSDQPAPGPLVVGTNRTVSVADRRDPANGAVAQANFVPAGATAVSANVTVTDTVGAGFLSINPGGVTTINASAINWSASGQILANGLSLTLNANREISVIAGGGGATNFIIDVLGYYL